MGLSSDWTTPTLFERIRYSIEINPLQLRTQADNDKTKISIKFFESSTSEELFHFAFTFNAFAIWFQPSCKNGQNIPMVNVPKESLRIWTIFKTSDHLRIFCNGIKVWERKFMSLSVECHSSLSSVSHFLLFFKGQQVATALTYRIAGMLYFKSKLGKSVFFIIFMALEAWDIGG